MKAIAAKAPPPAVLTMAAPVKVGEVLRVVVGWLGVAVAETETLSLFPPVVVVVPLLEKL